MIISLMAILSFFLAPKRGIVAKQWEQQQLQQTILEENLLKEFYHLGEKSGNGVNGYTLEQLIDERHFPPRPLKVGLNRLQRKGMMKYDQGRWQFTEAGQAKGKRVVKLHRLWELYLSTYLRIAPDHVHEDAETIEHIITPELEAELEKLLDYPEVDPHQSKIPY